MKRAIGQKITTCGVTQIPNLGSRHICQLYGRKKKKAKSSALRISFCFVASLSECMSYPPCFGWSFDFWSALICTWAQYPWEITHLRRTLIRFLLISVSVLRTITVSLPPHPPPSPPLLLRPYLLAGAQQRGLNRARRPLLWRLMPAEI